MRVEISRINYFSLLVSQKIGDIPSGRIVASNLMASLLSAPTVDLIEAMASKFCRCERCDGASLDAVAMVWIKSKFEVDAPWELERYQTNIIYSHLFYT